MTRRVDDLYVLGRPFELDDGKTDPESGDPLPPVAVWLQKLDPLDADKTLRKANAAKARMLMVRGDEDADEWLEMYADVATFNVEMLCEFLVTEDLAEFEASAEAEQAAADEWSKDDYLQGLRDAWEGSKDEPGLKEREEDDPERAKCWAELTRFSDKLTPLIEAEKRRLIDDRKGEPIENLRKEAVRLFIERRAGSVWLNEFRTCEIGYGVRDATDHSRYYFGAKGKETEDIDFNRVRRLPPESFTRLSNAYGELVVPPQEGKDSPEAPSSSQPSGLSGEVETVQPSGPPVATP